MLLLHQHVLVKICLCLLLAQSYLQCAAATIHFMRQRTDAMYILQEPSMSQGAQPIHNAAT